jgi:ketosteroid isomerase-like protein
MRSAFTFLAFFFFFTSIAQKNDEKEILDLLSQQTRAWNQGNIDAFMSAYWDSDSLMFIGKDGITYGYKPTSDRYKKSYSDTAKMGQLTFDILQKKRLSPEYYFIVGKFFLKRSVGDLSGHFTLLFRKINGKWMIVADHSS